MCMRKQLYPSCLNTRKKEEQKEREPFRVNLKHTSMSYL